MSASNKTLLATIGTLAMLAAGCSGGDPGGEIYRSGELSRLTDEDVATLEELQIRTVVNFLLPQEIEKNGPDRLPKGAHEDLQPIQGEKAAKQTLAKIRVKAAETKGVSPDEIDMANVEAFYVLEGFYIDGTLDQAVAEYGSMDAYIRDGLGLADEEVEELRNQLLE